MYSGHRLLIVGAREGSNIGDSLFRAAQELGIEANICDTNKAWRIGTLRQSLLWHLAERRPVAFEQFNENVLRACSEFRPTILLATGRVPLKPDTLRDCRNRNIRLVNFLTDDPFNAKMRAPWFLETLPIYDILFTPRRSNIEDLQLMGCAAVRYLHFGYDPSLFYKSAEVPQLGYDLFFAGHAEAHRANLIAVAIERGLSVRLYGNGWSKSPRTKAVTLGEASVDTIRTEAPGCHVSLCCVRHDNRDGHSMRTFELAAVGACMLAEDTDEHRELFGPDGERVVYFSTSSEMLSKTQTLLRDAVFREKLKSSVHSFIISGGHTYADRLRAILEAI